MATCFQKQRSRALGIRYPIVQAPMAGGAATPELATAVCEAGGLASLGAAYSAPDAIRTSVADMRARTRKPFAVNLFVQGTPQPDPRQIARAMDLLQPIKDALGLPRGEAPARFGEDFTAQLEALIAACPPVASFTFGILTPAQVAALQSGGAKVIGTATSVAEARAWEAAGADLICAQGAEAGAHRGTFLGSFESSMIGTMALVPQVADAVRVPVIAAGGIMDGRGIAAALTLGAAGVQMGTAFLTCPEAATHPAWKNALKNARDDQTLVTRAFSGRHARGLVNEFMRTLDAVQDEIPAFPIQNTLTGPLRQAAAQANRPEFLALWAGQAAGMSRGLPAGELIRQLVDETLAALRPAAQC